MSRHGRTPRSRQNRETHSITLNYRRLKSAMKHRARPRGTALFESAAGSAKPTGKGAASAKPRSTYGLRGHRQRDRRVSNILRDVRSTHSIEKCNETARAKTTKSTPVSTQPSEVDGPKIRNVSKLPNSRDGFHKTSLNNQEHTTIICHG